MKYLSIAVIAGLSLTSAAQAQSFGDLLGGLFGDRENKKASEPDSSQAVIQPSDRSATVASVLTQSEAQAGLKEALIVGARAVGQQLSAENGYFKDGNIHIPLPGRLEEVQKQLSKFGLSGQLDDLELRMNRAAEAAAPQAADLVVSAVQSLTIEDAIALVQGGDTAATDLLRSKTEPDLMGLLRPYVEDTLQDAGALSMIDQVSEEYGVGQLGANARTQLIDHAVSEALDGLFFYLAREEQSIRNNPVERSTDLLRRVFGG